MAYRGDSFAGLTIAGTAVTAIATGKNHGAYDNSLIVYNAGPGTLVNGVLEYSPDGSKWGTLDGTTFQNLGSASMQKHTFTNTPNRQLRFRAVSGTDGTYVSATLSFWWDS